MKVYFISGLAADFGIFRHIRLPPDYQQLPLDWISPYKNETLANYAKRLAAGIDDSAPFMLVGLSLGGMIATEIAKIHRPQKLILISSVPTSAHLPWYFRLAGKLRIEQIVPVCLLRSASMLKRVFSAETSEDKAYLRQAIRNSDPKFVRWALTAIVTWQGAAEMQCFHIHGSSDLLLPVYFTRPTHLIKGGGHIMILTRGPEINKIINDIIKG